MIFALGRLLDTEDRVGFPVGRREAGLLADGETPSLLYLQTMGLPLSLRGKACLCTEPRSLLSRQTQSEGNES